MASGFATWEVLAGLLILGAVGYLVAYNVRLRAGLAQRGAQRRDSDSRSSILSALAHASRLVFNATDKHRAMHEALALLGRSVRADRVYVFENHREPGSDRLLASQRYEWVADGISPQLDNPEMQDMAYDEALPNWHAALARGEAVHGQVAQMPAEERSLLEPQAIRSIAVVPIFLDGVFWGQVGFDDCTRGHEWTRAEIDALQIAAATVGAAIRAIRSDQELRRLVSTDSLTGLCSRRSFLAQARKVFDRKNSRGRELALLIMDLDHFKAVNDHHGHPAGDQALRVFANHCRKVLGPDVLVARMGGEEFAVLLRTADAERAGELAERLRKQVRTTPVELAAGRIMLSVSIGLATARPTDDDFSDLLKRADRALYQAKSAGRNRVEIDPETA